MSVKTVSSQADAANPLGYEKEGKLLVGFAIPCIISMLVTSLYNIVDQIFIGQGVGLLGNAATNIAFPLSIACTAIALLLGIGSATNFSLQLGAGNEKRSAEYAGNGLCLMALFGTVLMAVTLLFLTPMLKFFGATPDVFPYAEAYTRIMTNVLTAFSCQRTFVIFYLLNSDITGGVVYNYAFSCIHRYIGCR